MVKGSDFINIIEQQTFTKNEVPTLEELSQNISENIGVVYTINNEIEYSIETNIVNLPLRYVNQLKKIIDGKEYVLMHLAIIEGPNVSDSNMKMLNVTGKRDEEILQWFKENTP